MKNWIKKVVRSWPFAAIAVILIPYGIVLAKAFAPYPFTCMDSSILLSEMERLAEGWIPYLQMHLNYPPLWFYLMATCKLVCQVPYNCYAFYLIIQYFILCGTAAILYRTTGLYTNKRSVQWAAVIFFLFMAFWYRAFFILFEPLSLLFGLSALYLTLAPEWREKKWHFLWVGLLASGSFLVKQFGLGFGLLVGLFLLIDYPIAGWQVTLKRVIYLIVGLTIPILICVFIWGHDFIQSTLLNGYGTAVNESIGEDVSMSAKGLRMLKQLLHFSIAECSIVLIGIVAFASANKHQKLVLWVISFAGIIGFTGQYYFCAYINSPHYNLYMLPFVCLLFPIIAEWAENKSRKAVCAICMAGSIIYGTCTFTSKNRKYHPESITLKTEAETIVQMEAEESVSWPIADGQTLFENVEALVPSDASFWIPNSGLLKYWFQINRLPPNMRDIAYSTGTSELTPTKAERQLQDAEYILCQEGDYWDRILRAKKQGIIVEQARKIILYKN